MFEQMRFPMEAHFLFHTDHRIKRFSSQFVHWKLYTKNDKISM